MSRPQSASGTKANHIIQQGLRRHLIVGVLVASLSLQLGCYQTVPVAGAALPPGIVTIQVNDRGRLLVGAKLGSLVDKVTGRVIRSDSLNIEVAVETAEDVRGDLARWGGEPFTIPREGIGALTQKKTSRWRTGLLLGGIVVGLVVALLTINGSSFGGDGISDPPVNPI